MKRALLIGTALLALSTAAFAAPATTAMDNVGVGYSVSGTVVLLGMVDNNNVELSLDGGDWAASTAGAQATAGGAAAAAEASGGSLQYTLYGLGNHKITVENTFIMGLEAYVPDSLSVIIEQITAAGSAANTLGTKATAFKGISYTAQNLITGISGTNTWTGAGDGGAGNYGAQVKYKLSANPGVNQVVVLYTILAET